MAFTIKDWSLAEANLNEIRLSFIIFLFVVQLSVQRDLLRFAQVFSQMIHVSESLRINNVLAVLAACTKELNVNKDKFTTPGPKDDAESVMEEFEMNIITALYLCTILTKVLKMEAANVTMDDRKKSGQLVYALNKLNLKLRDGQTLLHLAVNGIMSVDDFHTNDVCRFPCADTVRLLLESGASVSALDCSRNSPLHTLTATVRKMKMLNFARNIELARLIDIYFCHSHFYCS